MRKFTVFAVMILLLALTGGTVYAAQPPDGLGGPGPGAELGPGKGHVVSVLGVAQVQGRDVFVDVIVVVPPGADERLATLAALQEQGARPVERKDLQSAAFTTTGLVWPQFFDSSSTNNFVTQNYNPDNETLGGEAALTNSQTTWTNVSTSSFEFEYGGTTTRYPSLVRESPGSQYLDGNNDVGWLLLGGSTLGVTWYTTRAPYEADMALNINFSWSNNGVDDYDMETVFLHENGHVVGLGHSGDPAAVMYPYYGGIQRVPGTDDVAGISALYPSTSGAADFAIAASPSTRSVRAGSVARYTVTLTSFNGYNSAVGLSASGLPTGATATFNPNSVTPTPGGSTSKLTVSTARGTLSGTYPLTITASGTDLSPTTHQTNVDLVIK